MESFGDARLDFGLDVVFVNSHDKLGEVVSHVFDINVQMLGVVPILKQFWLNYDKLVVVDGGIYPFLYLEHLGRDFGSVMNKNVDTSDQCVYHQVNYLFVLDLDFVFFALSHIQLLGKAEAKFQRDRVLFVFQ